MSRKQDFQRIVELSNGLLTNADPQRGWPGKADLKLDDGLVRVAIHAGPEGLSHRGRDDVERRFQNPGKNRPMVAPADSVPLLLGVWDEGARPVLVGMDPTHRIGVMTRQSLFAPLHTLEEAALQGWAEHSSASDERIIAFHPELLPAYFQVRALDGAPPAWEIVRTIETAGFNDEEEDGPAERARRAASRLAAHWAFGRDVVRAYDGLCAVCNLDFDLIEGAHILPVEAPGSLDRVWNGLALCPSHHRAFDKHVMWVDPVARSVLLHPDLVKNADLNPACRRFVDSTGGWLSEPLLAKDRPRPNMFERRYNFYEERYAWVA